MIRTRDVILKDQIHNPLQDITLGKLMNAKQHILTVEKLDIPEKVAEAELDSHVSARVPIFQLENPLNLTKKYTEEDSTPKKNSYPTPSPTVSGKITQELYNYGEESS